MNSNNFFSFSRFYRLLCNDILLNHKKYLFTIAGGFILGFIVIYMQMPTVVYDKQLISGCDASKYFKIFTMCLIGLGVFVGSAFSELSSKIKTSNYLLIPASTFEKFMCQFIIRALAGTIIFLVIFWVDAHLARIAVLSHVVNSKGLPAGPEKYDFIENFHYSMFLIKNNYPVVTYWKLLDGIAMILIFFSVGMFLFSVKIFFRKLGLIKSVLAIVAVFYLFFIFMMVFSQIFFPETARFEIANMDYQLANGYYNFDIFTFSIAYLLPLFLLPLGYFKLKEKQL